MHDVNFLFHIVFSHHAWCEKDHPISLGFHMVISHCFSHMPMWKSKWNFHMSFTWSSHAFHMVYSSSEWCITDHLAWHAHHVKNLWKKISETWLEITQKTVLGNKQNYPLRLGEGKPVLQDFLFHGKASINLHFETQKENSYMPIGAPSFPHTLKHAWGDEHSVHRRSLL